MLSRRRLLMLMAVAASLHTPAFAQQILQIARDSPERKVILDAVRASVERTLGIKVVFVVDRITVFGDWAFASVHPRNEVGSRIDYRRTRIAKDFDPEQDSDLAGALLRRRTLSGRSSSKLSCRPTSIGTNGRLRTNCRARYF